MVGQLHIMDRTGHTTLEWDTETKNTSVKDGSLDPAYVAAEFNKLVSEFGNLGYGTTVEGENELLKRFDPVKTPQRYEKVTVAPQMSGG